MRNDSCGQWRQHTARHANTKTFTCIHSMTDGLDFIGQASYAQEHKLQNNRSITENRAVWSSKISICLLLR